jgi:hypothetical protein
VAADFLAVCFAKCPQPKDLGGTRPFRQNTLILLYYLRFVIYTPVNTPVVFLKPDGGSKRRFSPALQGENTPGGIWSAYNLNAKMVHATKEADVLWRVAINAQGDPQSMPATH